MAADRPRPEALQAAGVRPDAVIAINGGAVLVGDLPSRALKLVSEWASLHRDELEADWEQAKSGGIPGADRPVAVGWGDYYCSRNEGKVSARIRDALGALGWVSSPWPEDEG